MILFDGFSCNGNEVNINSCFYNGFGNYNCDYVEDIGVICSKYLIVFIYLFWYINKIILWFVIYNLLLNYVL